MNIEQVRSEMHQLIGRMCYYSLQSLSLNGFDANLLSAIQVPLKNVENLTIFHEIAATKPNVAHKLGEVFPGIRRLITDYIWLFDSVGTTFAHLKYVELIIPHLPFVGTIEEFNRHSMKTKESTRNFLESNPQICSLAIENCDSLEYLAMAKEFMINIENLGVGFSLPLNEEYSGCE